MIGGRHPIRGRKPADLRVRVDRPHSAYFRYTGPGQLVAKPSASVPRTPLGRTLLRWKAWLIGRPLASEEEIGERLSKRLALPIFSSDAISSSAYATEEILRVLVIGGAAAFLLSVEVAIAIAVLLAVVAISYRQVCRAFPNGGGAYAVARQELSPLLGLVAAAALLIDYVMTVAVSTSSAVEQLISIAPGINAIRIELALLSIALITVANLRGLRESGNIFAVPTYLFVVLALSIVGIGVFRVVTGQVLASPAHPEAMDLGTQTIGVFLVLKAFASGSVALTGAEAIANGVPAFKRPEAKNAGNTRWSIGRAAGDPLHRDHRHRPMPTTSSRPRRAPAARPSSPSWPRRCSAPATRCSTSSSWRRRSSCSWPRTRASTPSRDSPRILAGGRLHAPPVLVPRRPARVQLGHHPAVRLVAGLLLVAFGGQHHAPDPALLGGGVRLLHAQPDPAWSLHWFRGRRPAGGGGWPSTPVARC